MTDWRFIDSGPCSASYNMSIDEAIAISVRKGDAPATLRIYGWERPSVSLGCFQKITDVDVIFCAENNIPLVRRPTGGRAIFHGDEVTYSFSSANTGVFSGGLLDSYRRLSVALRSAIEALGLSVEVKKERERGEILSRSPLCFTSTSFGELSYEGKKLVGSAQKRWKDGFLQQGSIPCSIDRVLTKRIFSLGSPGDLRNSMIGLGEIVENLSPDKLKAAMRLSFEDAFKAHFTLSSLSQAELLLARKLQAQKYLSREWTYQR